MEPAITACIHMRLIARVDQGAPIHRIDAHNYAEEISALRDLIDAGLALGTLSFDAHLARPRENLASYEKRQHSSDNPVPRDIASHQVILARETLVHRGADPPVRNPISSAHRSRYNAGPVRSTRPRHRHSPHR